MIRILICDAISSDALAKLKTFKNVEVTVKTGLGKEELLETVPGHHCMIVRSATKATADLIEAAKKDLKLIIRGGVGVDNIDVAKAAELGVQVRNTPGASSASVAEMAIGLMFAIARKISFADASIKAGNWPKKECKGFELGGKTLGVLGFGRIGRETARRALALGMKVMAHDPFVGCIDMEGVKLVSKEDLVRNSDIITLHMPFDPKNGPVLGTAEFSEMKKGVCIVNCARGGVVDEKALVAAIDSGRVAGAGLDVFENEPPLYREVVEKGNVICTPHVGAQTDEAQLRVGDEIVEIIEDWIRSTAG
jgi:D-3-phosphoglycerate dehydrogenase